MGGAELVALRSFHVVNTCSKSDKLPAYEFPVQLCEISALDHFEF